MADPVAQSAQPVQTGNQLAGLQQLLSTVMGSPTQTTSMNPGNIAALQQLFQQLQGVDQNALLQSIFQQAGGAIPGLQQAYGNAVGARSGNNSAVAANLERLRMETTIAAQQQLAQQQIANQQIQANVGNSIAQATRGTTQTQRTAGQGGELAGLIGLTQAALKLTGSRDLTELYDKISGGSRMGPSASAPATTGAQFNPQAAQGGPAAMVGQTPVSGAMGPQLPTGGAADPFAAFLSGGSVPDFSGVPGMGSMEWAGGMELAPGFDNYSDQFAFGANELSALTGADPMDALMDVSGGFGTMNGGADYQFEIDPSVESYYGY